MPGRYRELFPLIWSSEMDYKGLHIPLVASYLWGQRKIARMGLPDDVKVEVEAMDERELAEFLYKENDKFCVLSCVSGSAERAAKPREERQFGRAMKALLRTGHSAYEVMGLDGYSVHLFLKTKTLTRWLKNFVPRGYHVNGKKNFMIMVIYKN